MSKIMTETESKAYNFIIDYIKENGFAPTYREVGKGIGIKSTDHVQKVIWSLDSKERIKVKQGQPRAIKVCGYEFVKVEN